MIYSVPPGKHSKGKQISLFQKGLKIVVYVLLVGGLTLINNIQLLAAPVAIPMISKSKNDLTNNQAALLNSMRLVRLAVWKEVMVGKANDNRSNQNEPRQ